MGSVFVTQEDRTIKGFAGKKYKVPFYLQFVPGAVVEVVHSTASQRYIGEHSINTIIAKPHITDKLYKRRAVLGEKDRYYPLLRSHGDVPSKGDPVLLCTIGKVNYYLGPLNAVTNSPTWNDDPSYTPEIIFDGDKISKAAIGRRGETQNFNKESLWNRMEKERKVELDYGSAIREAIGDYIIEGRHGNSLRIGSRSDNPYLFISNGRHPNNTVESINDGSLITITSDGTIQQHLASSQLGVNFILASDRKPNVNIRMGDMVSEVNNKADSQELIYNYDGNQVFLHSDRITLNSKQDDIYMSSIKDIHIGAGRHTTISTSESLYISCNKTFLGHKSASEPMVKGNELLDLLMSIVDMFSEVKVATVFGTVPLIPSPNLATVQTNIDKFLSNKHFIDE